jgi:hypothetical protein
MRQIEANKGGGGVCSTTMQIEVNKGTGVQIEVNDSGGGVLACVGKE